MLKAMIISGLKWRVEAHLADKVRPDQPLNGLQVIDDRCLMGGQLTGRKSKPFKRDRTDLQVVKFKQAGIDLMLNAFKWKV